MEDTPSDKKLMFAPFSSLISPTFWSKFNELKIDVLKLNEDPIPIWGFYGPHDIPDINPILTVDNTSFDNCCKPQFGAIKAPGRVVTTLSLENFKGLDYNEVMRTNGEALLTDLFTEDGLMRISENPCVLASFFILTFADLKKYKFLFWFGFPAVTLSSFETIPVGSVKLASDVFSNYEEIQNSIKESSEIINKGFFVIEKNSDDNIIKIKSLDKISQQNLDSLENLWFAFLDTSSVSETPSWVLRNYLVFLQLKLKITSGTQINVFAYRPGRSSVADNSFVIRLLIQHELDYKNTADAIKFVGWERNDKGNFGPKQVDAQMTMDPAKLSENAVDFNLKLMKWRLFPEFDLEMMHNIKCLIIGAGTLGCNVARCLMSWGVRNITFADNGNVSYSNPARQSLFFFEDCLNGGKEKARAAAENLRLIFPGINSKWSKIMIPMAGHPTSKSTINQVKKDYETLVELVKDCDVMFLLMDTRESRWLPTVLGAKYGKIVINAALGFDSYLVMRHGMRVLESPGLSDKRSLGCYYCTDVVAPGDSTKDRTLDQQCTVTRPGVSMIGSALAVELMTSILHHPLKGLAPAEVSEIERSSTLGLIPHTIRGFLCSGEQILPSFHSYDKCTACSEKVLEEFEARGFDFVLDVLNNPSDYLEKLTGLDKLKDSNDLTGIIELSDSDEG